MGFAESRVTIDGPRPGRKPSASASADAIGRRADARPSSDHVYVIEGADQRIRLGCCQNPQARLATCGTGSSIPPTLAYVVEVHDGFAIEQLARTLLDRHRGRGGWFGCTSHEAIRAIQTAACELGVPITGDDGEPIVGSLETSGWQRLAIVMVLWATGILLIGTDALLTLH